jgi:hypothetical protein
MLDVIRNIAVTYDSLHNGVRLAINDISIEYGGLFDSEFGHDWVYVPHVSHVEHRIGKQVDISNFYRVNNRFINLNTIDTDYIDFNFLIEHYTHVPYYPHTTHFHIRVR